MTSSANERYEWERGRGQGGNIGKRGPAHHISVSTYQHHRFTLFFLPSTSPSLRRPCYPRHRSRKRRPPSLSFSSPHVLFFPLVSGFFQLGLAPGCALLPPAFLTTTLFFATNDAGAVLKRPYRSLLYPLFDSELRREYRRRLQRGKLSVHLARSKFQSRPSCVIARNHHQRQLIFSCPVRLSN